MTTQLSLRKVAVLVLLQIVSICAATHAQDPLPSWNDVPSKKAILQFVRDTTDKSSSKFVPPEESIAAFDQDGTLWVWVEHPAAMLTRILTP